MEATRRYSRNGKYTETSLKSVPATKGDENTNVPLKKRECSKMCSNFYNNYLLDGPVLKLTWEEKKFIDKRVLETRMMVSLVQPPPNCLQEWGDQQEFLNEKRKLSFEIFKKNSEAIFGIIRGSTISEINSLGLLESRFLCCALTSVGVRLYGGNSDNTMVSSQYSDLYSAMLKSPWACSFEEEEKVIATLETVGGLIGADEKLEVLFTTAIMRGFHDPRAMFMAMETGNRHVEDKDDPRVTQKDYFEEPGHPNRLKPDAEDNKCSCEDPNMLTGVQFSLLLHRYLKDTRGIDDAGSLFLKLEGLIKPLYESQHVFYHGRLPV